MGELLCGEKRHIGAFINMRPNHGGSYQYVEFILQGLHEMTDIYNVTIIYMQEGWDEILVSEYPKLRRKKIPLSLETVNQEIDALHLDAVIFTSHGPWFFYELTFSTPLISVVHDLMYHYEPKSDLVYRNSEYFYMLLLRKSIGILVDSDVGKNQFVELFGSECSKKIFPLPFRAPKYLYEGKETPIVLLNEEFFLYPALMYPHKNHLNLILAVDFLKEQGIKVNLVLPGVKNGIFHYIDHLIKKLGLNDQIQLLDYVDGSILKYLYKKARAMIMPTFDGPTNIPVVEAMAMGCPVAVSNIYGMPDQVGEAGLLFDPKIVPEIAKVLKQLWLDDELCEKLSKNGLKQAEKYSKEIFNQRLRDNIELMLKNYNKEISYSNMTRLKDLCKEYKKVFIYGAGEIGFLIGWMLKKSFDIKLSGYVVSKKTNEPPTILDIPVYSVMEVSEELNESFIILALYEKDQVDVLKILERYYAKKIYRVTEEDHLEVWKYYLRHI